MSETGKSDAALALHRFGLGPKPGSIAAIASDPRGALIADLERGAALPAPGRSLPSSGQAFRAVADDNAERRARQILALRKQKEDEAKGLPKEPRSPDPAMAGPPEPNVGRQILLKEAQARIDAALSAEVGFAERLVWFWSNHFCISANKIPSMAGAYEREAIRPHVRARFAQMLLAAEAHPAMLIYLDNAGSIGPNSVAGINRSRGLNENLAREILELHTLGVRSGYTQDDVVSFAKVLTGWTFLPATDNPDHGGEFVFNRRLHEPGALVVLHKTYPDSGIEQGRAVLQDLARHPATASHIATKLARHFVSGEPPPDLIEALARTFRDTEGDLGQVARALVAAPAAWQAPRTRLKSPSEWAVAMVRAAGTTADAARFIGGQALLGEPLWRPPSPKGHPDGSAAWMDGLGQRLDIAHSFAERVAGRLEPKALLENALGPLATQETRGAVARADSRQQALTLAFMAPEFQRR